MHILRTVDDALALRAELRPGARLVVIGAGFIGGEVASTATKLGMNVTVIEAALAPLAGPLGVQLGTAVAQLHAEHGTRLLCGAPVAGLTGSDRVTGVELADGRHVSADVVLVGIGAIPVLAILLIAVQAGDGLLARASVERVLGLGVGIAAAAAGEEWRAAKRLRTLIRHPSDIS